MAATPAATTTVKGASGGATWPAASEGSAAATPTTQVNAFIPRLRLRTVDQLILLRQKIFVGVIPGRVLSTRARNPYPQAPWLWVPGSPHPISGSPENRHWIMRTSA